ncbi:MAG: alkane 1-monooxygenase [Burkholderiaceae bacterium]|nr:alkane 1-monooxygenase [Burkholderiaceae bacterium]
MNTLTAAAQAAPYRDRKRYAWILSILVPAFAGSGALLVMWTGDPRVAWLPVLVNYGLIPVLDLIMGEDLSNPPESAVPALEADKYYRYVTYASVPILWLSFIISVWFLATHEMPWHAQLALVLSAGVASGFGINLGHELGHKNTAVERWLAKVILAPTGYGHFFIEHNRGHHRDVATPADPASSRMGETIYTFVLREMPGALRRAWRIEKDRLGRTGQPVWSLHNEVLQPAAITAVLWTVMLVWLGWGALPFIVGIAFWANFQLSSANYIEHYGLLRKERAPGRYEVCQPHHSWNSNHIFSNWVTFHLQRHSDHHAHPTRRYQSLRHFENLPQLPNGYFGMFLACYLPPFWFWLMDRRVVELAQGDVSRIHFQPGQQARLMRKFGLQAAADGARQ